MKVGNIYYFFDDEDYDPSTQKNPNKKDFTVYRLDSLVWPGYGDYSVILTFSADTSSSDGRGFFNAGSYFKKHSRPFENKYLLKEDTHAMIDALFRTAILN